MTGELPETACCRKCGYLLRGLPEPICPECGRPFDPVDRQTYAPSVAWRRRRKWLPRIVTVAVLAIFLFVFAPRGIIKGQAVFTCQCCAHTVTVEWWEPEPPAWIPFRYPGLSWSTDGSGPATSTQLAAPCQEHHFFVSVNIVRHGNASVSATGMADPGEQVVINGIIVTPKSAPAVLRSIVLRNGARIRFDEVPP
jgi:hypothetical protein